MCARDDKARWSIAVGAASPPRGQRDHDPGRPKFPSVYARDDKKCMRNNCRAKGKRLGKLEGEQSPRDRSSFDRERIIGISRVRGPSLLQLPLPLLPFPLTDAITTAGKLTWQRPDSPFGLHVRG